MISARAARLAAQGRRCFSSELLHESALPSMHFQSCLPRLPVPPLAETLDKHLVALAPLVTPAQFADAEAATADFRKAGGAGEALQAQLLAQDAANPHTSYFSEWWFDMYLSDRQPLPINYNPQLTFKMDPAGADSPKNGQVARAAGLVHSSVRFLKTLRSGNLAPDLFEMNKERSQARWYAPLMKALPASPALPAALTGSEGVSARLAGTVLCGAYPLDMSQYENLFASTRLPGEHVDRLATAAQQGVAGGVDAVRHIVVQRGTRFYELDVIAADGSAVPTAQLMGALQAIVDAAPDAAQSDSSSSGLGVLTTLPRDQWAAARAELASSNPLNAASLASIDSALFLVCLDEACPGGATCDMATMSAAEVSAQGSDLLHGNGRNRWFDKSFELIVCANGRAAVNFEHSWGDGVCVLRYANEVFDDAAAAPLATAAPADDGGARELGWQLSDATASAVAAAGETFDAWLNRLTVKVSLVPGVGSAFPKQAAVGQDALLQMAIQLGHYKLHGKAVSTYESASTAAFKRGRTETIRSATAESAELCAVMERAGSSREEKVAAFAAAAKKHNGLTKDALMGKGVDRHLFGLRKLAEQNGNGLPAMYKTEAMDVWGKIILSTSTLSSHALEGGGFGPVNDECYGVGYGMEEGRSAFVMSTYRSDGAEMGAALAEGLQDLAMVLKPE